jgi:hypothetical protein
MHEPDLGLEEIHDDFDRVKYCKEAICILIAYVPFNHITLDPNLCHSQTTTQCTFVH